MKSITDYENRTKTKITTKFFFDEKNLTLSRKKKTEILRQTQIVTKKGLPAIEETSISTKIETLLSCKLKPISVDDLKEKYRSINPGFIFKKNNRYFYTDIPASKNIPINISTDNLVHKCCSDLHICNHLNGRSVKDGGCQRVRAFGHAHIIDYPFITKGYEIINRKDVQNYFIILECENFSLKKSRRSRKDLSKWLVKAVFKLNTAFIFFSDIICEYIFNFDF